MTRDRRAAVRTRSGQIDDARFDVDPPEQLTGGKHIVGLPDVPEDMRQFVVDSEAAA